MAVITISRRYGTGSIQMARALAQKLGYRFIFREELVQAFRDRGLNFDLERFEGRPPTLFERLFQVNREELREALRQIMEEAARDGNVVIAGWGGQIFLKDREDTLHVRIIGSEESRIRHLMDSGGMNRSGAKELIRRADRDQSLFSQYFFEADFFDAKLYHIVLNMEQLSPEQMMDIITELLPEPEASPA